MGLSNYATKADLKNATGNDISSFAIKVDLASLKSNAGKLDIGKLKNVPTNLSNLEIKVDKLDVDKLVPFPVDLNKLSVVVKNDVVKEDVYNVEIKNIEYKILSITNLATKSSLNAKVNEVKGEIPRVSNLVKRTDYNTKTNEIEQKITDHNYDKYINTLEFNKLTSENFAARFKQANSVNKTDFDDKLKNLNKKITSNKTKRVLIESELKKLQTVDSSLFIGQSYFNNDGTQIYLIFQPIYKAITISGLSNKIAKWESNGSSNEKFRLLYTANKILSPKLQWNEYKIKLRFEGSFLKQEDTTSITLNDVVSLFIVYELATRFRHWFYIRCCLFGGVKLTKNTDPDKYSYSDYGLGFDTRGYHSLPDGNVAKNVIIFGVDMSSSVGIDNRGKIS